MNPNDPNFTPPGLPPDAQRLLSTREALESDLLASKLRWATLPINFHDLALIVNGLAVLECSQVEMKQLNVAQLCRELQLRLRKEIPFAPTVREQMNINRQFLNLPPL